MFRTPFVLAVGWLAVLSRGAALEKQPASEYHARRVALASKLNGGAALIFSADEPEMNYLSWRQDEDFYYLTGWNEPGAALLVEAAVEPSKEKDPDTGSQPASAEPYREILFVRARNPRLELYKGAGIYANTPDAAKLAGVDEVRPMTDLQAELVRLALPTDTKTYSVEAGSSMLRPTTRKRRPRSSLSGVRSACRCRRRAI